MPMRRAGSIIVLTSLALLSCMPNNPGGGDQTPNGNTGNDNTGQPAALAEAPPFAPDDALIPVPTLGSKPLLNEVRYPLAEGEVSFIELKGATAADLAAGLSLRNEKGDVYAIPASLQPADTNGIVTVFFDGQDQITGDAAHAGVTSFLDADSGFVVLEDSGGAQLDRVSWGEDEADGVRMHGTGLVALPTGVGCSRRPQSTSPAAEHEWYLCAPPDVTPGKPNRNLGARMLFPFDGALVTIGDIRLDWEFVKQAVQFEIQVATDVGFTALVVDQIVTDGPVALTLPVGGYYWRVQAAFGDGSLADWSPIRRLVVAESIDEDAVPEDEEPAAKSIAAMQGTPRRKKLSRRVPMYFQRKDSHMLLLESDGPSGTSHAWDAPHARLDKGDPADRTNCALASISMVNAFFAQVVDDQAPPHLTQDRIGFHIHTSAIHPDSTNHPGPEFDLNFDSGNEPKFYQAGLDFALGMEIPSAYRGFSGGQAVFKFLGIYPKEFREQFWKDLGDAIAADKPVPFAVYNGPTTFESHAMVARLRLVIGGVRYVQVNDPWEGVMYYPLDSMYVFEYWMIPDGVTPRADEEELRNQTDSDNDGIMDFEERERFKTRWEEDRDRDRDTDQDCVEDLAEVRNSVLDTKHGWGQYWTKLKKGLPVQSDGSARMGKQPELEGSSEGTDSDGAGMPDPMEDLNRNGKHDESLGETSIFDSSDDSRTIKGYKEIFEDSLDPQTLVHTESRQRAEYDLQVTSDGKIQGTVSVTQNYKTTQELAAGTGGVPACFSPRTRTSTMRELMYTRKVKAFFFCQVLHIVVDPYEPLPDQPVDIIDACWYPGSVGVGSMPVYQTIGMTTEQPSSTTNGKVTYTHSTTKTEDLGRTGTFRTEWDIAIEK